MTDRFREPDDLPEREDPADRDERLYESERDAQAVAETRAADGVAKYPRSQWEWFGNAGHYICGRWCRFHLCTKIGPFVVSTVGEYVHPSNSGGSEATEAAWMADNQFGAEIGMGRKFETMVFRHTGSSCECGCGLPDHGGDNIDFDGYNTPTDARDGHMAMCEKYAAVQRCRYDLEDPEPCDEFTGPMGPMRRADA